MTFRGAAVRDTTAAYGGLIDAAGGVATVVLAVCGLANVNPPILTAIATIVFGVALLIQGGTMMSEYAQAMSPTGGVTTTTFSAEELGGSSLSAVFLVGAAGIVLGILALLNIHGDVLLPSAVIAFGAALLLSSNAVWRIYVRRNAARTDTTGMTEHRGREMVASEMASGSSSIQALAGLAAVVLGILALTGAGNDAILNLVALLALGATLVLTGSALSATVMGFMRPLTR